MNTRVWTRASGAALAVLLAAGCRPRVSETAADRAAVSSLAARVQADVQRIEARTHQLADATARTYGDADRIIAGVDTNQYRFTADGCYYKAVEDGRPALWVSGVVPVDQAVQRVAWATEGIDDELESISRDLPAVAQVYYNDRSSVNRIFPPFDVLTQYEPKMRIPDFNFYYLADAAHNRERRVVWVDEPYVDPAGRGWMVSCIAPVYQGDDLMGVVGLDVTVAGIVANYLQPVSRAWALVDRRGTIVAATEVAVELFAMPSLIDHRYINTVKSDRYRSENYNLLQSPNTAVRRMAWTLIRRKAPAAVYHGPGGLRLVLAEPVPALGWTVLLVADPEP